MKTRKEIAEELAAKAEKQLLSKETQEIKYLLNSFLSDLRAVDLTVEHSYRLSDETRLNKLENTIKTIPSEIIINNKHTTDKVSHKFLWWYFAVSILFISSSIGFGISQYYTYSDKLATMFQKEQRAYSRGLEKGRMDVFNSLPTNSQNFLINKHPGVFGDE